MQIATLGAFGRLSVDAGGLLTDVHGNSSEDVTVHYQILGDLSQVTSASIVVKDDTGATVFSSPAEVKASGSVTWSAGQPLHATSDSISFKIVNPDGTVSLPFDAVPEYVAVDVPTPVITNISPVRIPVGSSQQTRAITGRNFLSSTQIQITNDNAASFSGTPILT